MHGTFQSSNTGSASPIFKRPIIQKADETYLGSRTFQIRQTAGVKTISGPFGKAHKRTSTSSPSAATSLSRLPSPILTCAGMPCSPTGTQEPGCSG